MRIEAVSYSHPDAVALVAEVQQEYVARYGNVDKTPVSDDEFSPPLGLFLVGYFSSVAVACGGWRAHSGTDAAEIKRMFVRDSHRGRGFARAMIAALERTAAEAGFKRMVLNTGLKQPEAVALYRSAGYTDTEPFGYYASAPLSVHLAKPLS
jgi:GNAT superfamily N-acetyltransferase